MLTKCFEKHRVAVLAQQCMVGRKGRSASHVWHAYKLLAVVPFLEVGGMDAPNLYE